MTNPQTPPDSLAGMSMAELLTRSEHTAIDVGCAETDSAEENRLMNRLIAIRAEIDRRLTKITAAIGYMKNSYWCRCYDGKSKEVAPTLARFDEVADDAVCQLIGEAP